jgi:hypothetical protein
MTDIAELEAANTARIEDSADLAALEEARVALLGKSGNVTLLARTLGGLSLEDRKILGPQINQMRDRLAARIEARKSELEAAELAVLEKPHQALRVLLEDVAVDHLHAVRHAGPLGVALRQRGELRVVLDADGPSAEPAGGPDRDLAVPRAEVVDEVVGGHPCQLEHRQQQRIERRHPHHILAALPDERTVGLVAGPAGRTRGQRGRQQGDEGGAAGRQVHRAGSAGGWTATRASLTVAAARRKRRPRAGPRGPRPAPDARPGAQALSR